MTDDHKAALAQGRTEGRVVREYLEALRANTSKRGRKRTTESISNRLSAIDEQLADADALTELKLVQERRDLATELAAMGQKVDLATLEAAFVEVAASYSRRQRISYSSWRDVGVPASVLRSAGISQGQ